MNVYIGTIVFVMSRKEHYGFICAKDKYGVETEIFFHYAGFAGPVLREKEVGFGRFTQPSRIPRRGDEVAFVVTGSEGDRPKASPWTFADDYRKLQAQAAVPNVDTDPTPSVRAHRGPAHSRSR